MPVGQSLFQTLTKRVLFSDLQKLSNNPCRIFHFVEISETPFSVALLEEDAYADLKTLDIWYSVNWLPVVVLSEKFLEKASPLDALA
jgi:hypothetical protein